MNANRLGPFTGRQLTTIIVTLIVVVLFPLGAWAVTGSNVFVTDATSGTVSAQTVVVGTLGIAGLFGGQGGAGGAGAPRPSASPTR